jgi:Ca2+-binding RTX toxin-like protein
MGIMEWSRVVAVLTLGCLLATTISVAEASHVPDCFNRHPTNTPTNGNDVIIGTIGNDVLAGGPGDDVIEGRGGDDRLCGDEGNDKILGNSGTYDRIDGGPGNDEISGGEFFPGVTGVSCGLAEGSTGEPILSGDRAVNVVRGGAGDDLIAGSADVDTLQGGDGDDCIMGLNGDDFLAGGAGADFISAGPGADIAVGGDDYDQLFGQEDHDRLFAGSTDVHLPEFPDSCEKSGEFAGGQGPLENGDAVWGGFNPFKLNNNLFGGDGYDRLVGTNRADNLQGDERGDDLYGLGGNDNLRGGSGADCLAGGPGRDLLFDDDPSDSQPPDGDTLWGGGSPDTLNALDGDPLDELDGGSSIADKCTFDQGDDPISC